MTLMSLEAPVFISILAFFTTLLFFMGILQYFRQHSKKRELIEKIRQSDGNRTVLPEENSFVKTEGTVKTPVFDFLSFLGKRVAPEKSIDYSQMRIKFLKAGIRRINAPAVFWGTKFLLAMILPAGFFLGRLTVFRLFDPTATLAIGLFLALAGFYLPETWLRMKAARRKNEILEGLPDALDLLVVCVEAGMGLDAAIHRVAQEIELSNKVLSDELKLVNLEMRAGKLRQDAFKNLAIRTDLEDVNSLVTLLIQTDKFGTSVARTLRVYSDSFRTKRYQRAEEIAAKLPVKLVFPCILFIFPSLFVAILGPAAIRIYQVFLHP